MVLFNNNISLTTEIFSNYNSNKYNFKYNTILTINGYLIQIKVVITIIIIIIITIRNNDLIIRGL
jgi:hypothetical protein